MNDICRRDKEGTILYHRKVRSDGVVDTTYLLPPTDRDGPENYNHRNYYHLITTEYGNFQSIFSASCHRLVAPEDWKISKNYMKVPKSGPGLLLRIDLHGLVERTGSYVLIVEYSRYCNHVRCTRPHGREGGLPHNIKSDA